MSDKIYSIALHDLRVSDPDAVEKLDFVINFFKKPLTVHLVCDAHVKENKALSSYILSKTKKNQIEVVYHGVNHRCEKKGWRLLYWYHHYEAEYIIDSEKLRVETEKGFKELSSILKSKPGICPPCWIASKKNISFLDSIQPLYRETLLFLVRDGKRKFSSVVSLGSPRKADLFFLRAAAKTIRSLSILLKIRRVRMAVHICDLSNNESMSLFKSSSGKLEVNGYKAVLQRKLS